MCPEMIQECILRFLGRGVEARAGEVITGVRADYGSVTSRTILRHLMLLSKQGTITRAGLARTYMYSRAKKRSCVSFKAERE